MSQNNHKSRRDFLKTSGKIAATGAAMTTLGTMTAPRVHAAENSEIKLALVGCGGRGGGAVANAFSTTGGPIKLHAMADIFDERLESKYTALANRFNVDGKTMVDVPEDRRFLGFDAYKKAIDCLDPGDVVILTTQAAFRPVHYDYAVEKGVNVFMEKSFAVDSPATRRLAKANEIALQKDLKVSVGFMWRHSKARQECIKRLHDGAIGDLHTLRIYRTHGPVMTPKRPEGMNPMEFQLRYAARLNWLSSGFYIDWHCHNVDQACWAKDAWPVNAQAMGARIHESAGNIFDQYAVEYTFEDGAKLFAFSRHMNGCWNTYSDYAAGTKGAAVLMKTLSQPYPQTFTSLNMSPDTLTWEYGERDPNPYDVEWQVLVDAIRNDTKHNEAGRAIEANYAAIMGRAAAHGGKMVTIDQVKNSEFQYFADIDNITFDSTPPVAEDENGVLECTTPGKTVEI